MEQSLDDRTVVKTLPTKYFKPTVVTPTAQKNDCFQNMTAQGISQWSSG